MKLTFFPKDSPDKVVSFRLFGLNARARPLGRRDMIDFKGGAFN